jgi:hypothetical protein
MNLLLDVLPWIGAAVVIILALGFLAAIGALGHHESP